MPSAGDRVQVRQPQGIWMRGILVYNASPHRKALFWPDGGAPRVLARVAVIRKEVPHGS